MPRLDGLYLEDRTNAVAVEEFTEFMAERGSVVFTELEVRGLTLIHSY